MSFWQKRNKYGWTIGLCIGIFCLTMGLFNDQFTDIMRKAIMICLECIGIG